MLSYAQIQQFKIDGYLVIPEALTNSEAEQLLSLTKSHLAQRIEPFELETEVQYPGAPASSSSKGGETIRRLLLAYQRDELYREQAERPIVVDSVQNILDCNSVLLNPNHHNCVMTKQPEFSSETLWHRDTRYWSFNDKYLINAWFALGDELEVNGAMKVLPGSHRWEVRDEALDEAQFLILDHADNVERLKTQRVVELNKGDLLLFSAHCFHAAGRNITQQTKFSLVFSYHGEQTKPLANSRSANMAEIKIR